MPEENKHILGILDSFSGDVRFIPILDGSYTMVREAIQRAWVLPYGTPRLLISCNRAELFRQLVESYNIGHWERSVPSPSNTDKCQLTKIQRSPGSGIDRSGNRKYKAEEMLGGNEDVIRKVGQST